MRKKKRKIKERVDTRKGGNVVEGKNLWKQKCQDGKKKRNTKEKNREHVKMKSVFECREWLGNEERRT